MLDLDEEPASAGSFFVAQTHPTTSTPNPNPIRLRWSRLASSMPRHVPDMLLPDTVNAVPSL
ncbi:hypothetical protein G1C94_0550 [Bifidobacterium sp. DSM 109963]|uniref:Uncharacterized protein n=1 Tax=Bifidobacterium panos TaxID=2675321 RepID=A0ABX1SXC7_9BIFI|nr:hypothetical protein [Bifidobacterium sp. DSM 109963]